MLKPQKRNGDISGGRFPWEQVFQMNKLRLARIFQSRSLFSLRLHFSSATWHRKNRQKVGHAGSEKAFFHKSCSLCLKQAKFCSDMQTTDIFFNGVAFCFLQQLYSRHHSLETKINLAFIQ